MTRRANCSRCGVARAEVKFNCGDAYCPKCRTWVNAEQYAMRTTGEKRCVKCEVKKPENEFAWDGHRKRNDCKECQRKYQRERRSVNGEPASPQEEGPKHDFALLMQHWTSRVNESQSDTL